MKKDLKDKIFGAIYGCAIGDALGLATEFMTREEVAFRYPRGVETYDDIYRDAHRALYAPGDWTANTELILRILEHALEQGRLNALQMAEVLKKTYEDNSLELPSQYHFMMRHPDYLERPMEVAEDVWRSMGANRASNEAMTRAIIAGLFATDPVERGMEVCKVTHADPLCVGSCGVVAQMSHDLLWNETPTFIGRLKEIAESVDDKIVPFIDMATEPTLATLDLDDNVTFWYTRKTMGSALWAVWQCEDARQALDAFIAEGGDTCINASAALIMLGARDGFSALPKNLVEGLTNRERLDHVANALYEKFADRDLSDK